MDKGKLDLHEQRAAACGLRPEASGRPLAAPGGKRKGSGLPPRIRKSQETEKWCASIAISSLRTREEPLRVESTDTDASLAELASSVPALGIIEPIIVREAGGVEFEVISAERRLRVARLLQLLHVPCVVRECSDSIALLTALTENLQRADLSPIERAYGLKRLVDEFGLTAGGDR